MEGLCANVLKPDLISKTIAHDPTLLRTILEIPKSVRIFFKENCFKTYIITILNKSMQFHFMSCKKEISLDEFSNLFFFWCLFLLVQFQKARSLTVIDGTCR